MGQCGNEGGRLPGLGCKAMQPLLFLSLLLSFLPRTPPSLSLPLWSSSGGSQPSWPEDIQGPLERPWGKELKYPANGHAMVPSWKCILQPVRPSKALADVSAATYETGAPLEISCSWPTETGMINICCFKLVSFGAISGWCLDLS